MINIIAIIVIISYLAIGLWSAITTYEEESIEEKKDLACTVGIVIGSILWPIAFIIAVIVQVIIEIKKYIKRESKR